MIGFSLSFVRYLVTHRTGVPITKKPVKNTAPCLAPTPNHSHYPLNYQFHYHANSRCNNNEKVTYGSSISSEFHLQLQNPRHEEKHPH